MSRARKQLREELNDARLELERDPYVAANWLRVAYLTQINGELGVTYELDELKHAYLRALDLAPTNPEALLALGEYFDVRENAPREAERFLRQAAALARSDDGYGIALLARVLAELGAREDALELLAYLPDDDDGPIERTRREIEHGVWDP